MSPGAVHIQGTSYVCHNHWNGTGEPYLEEGHID